MVCGKTRTQHMLKNTKSLLTTRQLSNKIPDEIIDTDITTIRTYMDDRAWEALTKQGIFNSIKLSYQQCTTHHDYRHNSFS